MRIWVNFWLRPVPLVEIYKNLVLGGPNFCYFRHIFEIFRTDIDYEYQNKVSFELQKPNATSSVIRRRSKEIKMVHQVKDKADFKAQLKAAGGKLVVVDFYATW